MRTAFHGKSCTIVRGTEAAKGLFEGDATRMLTRRTTYERLPDHAALPPTASVEDFAVSERAVTSEEVARHMPLVHQTVARFLRKLPPNVTK